MVNPPPWLTWKWLAGAVAAWKWCAGATAAWGGSKYTFHACLHGAIKRTWKWPAGAVAAWKWWAGAVEMSTPARAAESTVERTWGRLKTGSRSFSPKTSF